MGRGGGSRSSGGSRGASSRPSTPHTSAPSTTTKTTSPPPAAGAPPARAASTTAKPPATAASTTKPHAPPAHAPAQQRNNTMGSFMRGAMIGMAAGLLSSIGLHALFGGVGRNMERSDIVAAGLGAGTTLGSAFLFRNRHLFAKRSPLVVRPPIQYPRRPIVLALVGVLGGIMVNSMRLESKRLENQAVLEQAAVAEPQAGYNRYGDEVPKESA